MSDDNGSDDDRNTLSDATKKILEGLTEREAKVLKQKFGISLDSDLSIEEVGKQFDVTKERIQAIEDKALRRLRKQSDNSQPYCSFCGKNKDEVERLVASQISDTFICGECIKVSMGILDE